MSANRLPLVASLAFAVLLGTVPGRTFLLARNTFAENGRSVSAKSELGMAVIGAIALITGRHLLPRGRANLGANHGFRAIIQCQPLDNARLSPTSGAAFVLEVLR